MADQIVRRVGFRRSINVCRIVSAWGVFMELNGRPPRNVDEYAVFRMVAASTGYKDMNYFRQAFPGYEDPTALWEQLRERVPGVSAKTDPAALALRIGAVALP